jgi:hypothetical protein
MIQYPPQYRFEQNPGLEDQQRRQMMMLRVQEMQQRQRAAEDARRQRELSNYFAMAEMDPTVLQSPEFQGVRERGGYPEIRPYQPQGVDNFLESVPEGYQGSARVGPRGRFQSGTITRKTPVHTQHYLQQVFGELVTGSPYSPMGIPMETLTNREEHIAYATKKLGPDWQKDYPQALEIINRKFPTETVGTQAVPKQQSQQRQREKSLPTPSIGSSTSPHPLLAPYWAQLPDDVKRTVIRKLMFGNKPAAIVAALKDDGTIR